MIRAPDDRIPHADPDVEPLPDQNCGPRGVPVLSGAPSCWKPTAGSDPLLRTAGRWFPHPLPAPVLVLRAPGGVHRRRPSRGRRSHGVPENRCSAGGGPRHAHISALDVGVAHHMLRQDRLVLPRSSRPLLLIAVPTASRCSLDRTMWGGAVAPHGDTVLDQVLVRCHRRLTGVMLASPTLDFHLTDTYFVVAHFHYVMGGTVIFASPPSTSWPKTGRFLDERLGRSLLADVRRVQHDVLVDLLGRDGAPPRRRLPGVDHVAALNRVASIGMVVLTLFRPVPHQHLKLLRTEDGRAVRGRQLAGVGDTRRRRPGFSWLPPIRSERPGVRLPVDEPPDVSDRHDRGVEGPGTTTPLDPAAPVECRGEPRETRLMPRRATARPRWSTRRGRPVRTELIIWSLVVAYYAVLSDLLGRRRRRRRGVAAADGTFLAGSSPGGSGTGAVAAQRHPAALRSRRRRRRRRAASSGCSRRRACAH